MRVFQRLTTSLCHDDQPSGVTSNQPALPDYRIALDFGTTYTTVAFIKKGGEKDRIHTIDGFKGDRCLSLNGRQVPTESVYIQNTLQSNRASTGRHSTVPLTQFRRLHGYEAQRWLETPHPNEVAVAHVRRMKLLLDDNPWTQGAKRDTEQLVAKLKSQELIHSERDIMQHILKYYFKHIKKTLERDYGFKYRDTGMY
jgi:molecular chaperone DnaK (HSP70)